MSIPRLDYDQFVAHLRASVSPSSPIQVPNQLHGREQQLQRIDQALQATGRSVFIYGDRGVGKTSLAQTAAFLHQSANKDPIFITCSRGSTFFGLIKAIAANLLPTPMTSQRSATASLGVNIGILAAGGQRQQSAEELPQVDEMNAAVRLVKFVGQKYSSQTTVVVDEFDLVTNADEKALFADFIKQLGDQQVPVQFIFCGIGESLDALLGAHPSAYRYIEAVQVDRLHFEPRWAIIDRSAAAMGVVIPKEPRFRIAAISDGFPYYVHLICEKLYWEMFNAEEAVNTVTETIYSAAIKASIDGIQQELRRAYERATAKRSAHYEPILWAAADHSSIPRATEAIYTSYLGIMKELEDEPAPRASFRRHLAALRQEKCGTALLLRPPGYHRFRESILRGYVRLRAEAEGVMLDPEYGDPPTGSTAMRSWALKPIRGWRRLMRGR